MGKFWKIILVSDFFMLKDNLFVLVNNNLNFLITFERWWKIFFGVGEKLFLFLGIIFNCWWTNISISATTLHIDENIFQFLAKNRFFGRKKLLIVKIWQSFSLKIFLSWWKINFSEEKLRALKYENLKIIHFVWKNFQVVEKSIFSGEKNFWLLKYYKIVTWANVIHILVQNDNVGEFNSHVSTELWTLENIIFSLLNSRWIK